MKEYDLIAGCLAGLAIGDALGAPYEWKTSAEIREGYPEGIKDFIPVPEMDIKAGQVTDDTELALFVSDSLIERGGLDMDDIVKRIINWAGSYKGVIGPSTGKGIEALKNGVHWSLAGNIDQASSGCLPRCIPVALVTPLDKVVEYSLNCCKPTHRHPEALAAVAVLNFILAKLIAGESWEKSLADVFSNEFEPELLAEVKEPLSDLIKNVRESDGAVGVLGVALGAVNNACNAEEAIINAVYAGGDTDTCGAVAGALAGARWGLKAIPERWLKECDASDIAIKTGYKLAQLRASKIQ